MKKSDCEKMINENMVVTEYRCTVSSILDGLMIDSVTIVSNKDDKVLGAIFLNTESGKIERFMLPMLEDSCDGKMMYYDNIRRTMKRVGVDNYINIIGAINFTIRWMIDYIIGTDKTEKARMSYDGREWRNCIVKGDVSNNMLLTISFEDSDEVILFDVQRTDVLFMTDKIEKALADWIGIKKEEVYDFIKCFSEIVDEQREEWHKSEDYKKFKQRKEKRKKNEQ